MLVCQFLDARLWDLNPFGHESSRSDPLSHSSAGKSRHRDLSARTKEKGSLQTPESTD